MPLTWLPGLYAPTKDLVKGVIGLRSRGVALTIQAHAQGPRTWIIVTAQCRPGGKPVLMRGCWAEIYETAFDACSGPQPVRTRVINFRPGGPIKIQPGELPVRWEAQVLNEHLRRAVAGLDDVATIEAYGEKQGHEALALRDRRPDERQAFRERHPLIGVLAQLVETPRGEMMHAVLESAQGQCFVTRDIKIPPSKPFSERFELLSEYLAARRSRSTDSSPDQLG